MKLTREQIVALDRSERAELALSLILALQRLEAALDYGRDGMFNLATQELAACGECARGVARQINAFLEPNR